MRPIAGISPASIVKEVRDITQRVKAVAEKRTPYITGGPASRGELPRDEMVRLIKDLETQMRKAAGNLEFEKAALIRDQIVDLRKVMVDEDIAKPAATPAG